MGCESAPLGVKALSSDSSEMEVPSPSLQASRVAATGSKLELPSLLSEGIRTDSALNLKRDTELAAGCWGEGGVGEACIPQRPIRLSQGSMGVKQQQESLSSRLSGCRCPQPAGQGHLRWRLGLRKSWCMKTVYIC